VFQQQACDISAHIQEQQTPLAKSHSQVSGSQRQLADRMGIVLVLNIELKLRGDRTPRPDIYTVDEH